MKTILRSMGVEHCPLRLDRASRMLKQMVVRRERLESKKRRPQVVLQPLSEENPNLTLDWDSVRFCEKLRF